MDLVALIAVIALALVFNFTNGFHDSANAIACAVSTRALTPRAALTLGAVMNLIGSLAATGVAVTIANGIFAPPSGTAGLGVLLCALIGAIVWNIITWSFGLPSSSSQALIGGMVGAGIASSTPVFWGSGVLGKVIIPMVISPVVGLVLGYGFMVAVLWIMRRANPGRVERGFRKAQIFSAASLALGHGLQDAQKSIGVIVLALVTAGQMHSFSVPLWVSLASAVTMAAGTYSGGWRIIRTLGRRIFPLRPQHGFVAEATGSLVLFVSSFIAEAPISTTHVITSAVMGVGATRRLSAVRWGVAREIAMSWVLTLPGSALVAALSYAIISLF